MKTLYSSYIHFFSFRAGFGLDIRQYNSLSCFIGQTCVLYFTFLIPVIYNFKFDRYTLSNLMFIIYSLFMGRLEMHQQYWQQQLIESYYIYSFNNEWILHSINYSFPNNMQFKCQWRIFSIYTCNSKCALIS